MKILCLGDVVGSPGREVIARTLPDYRVQHSIDFIVANVENVAAGSGVTRSGYLALRNAGIDVCTTGDHVFKRGEILKLFESDADRILRPINYPAAAAGRGMTTVQTVAGVSVTVINVQGRVFMDPSDDPFKAVDEALARAPKSVIVVDMHGEATSEKRAFGWHLDGRVSIVFGTHTHVPTADEEILTNGTAYVTDLGMCGPYRSVIGRNVQPVLTKFTTNMYAPFSVAEGDARACGVLVEVDPDSGRAASIERVVLR